MAVAVRMKAKSYFKGVLPWLLVGPVSGPLAEGIVRNWRAGEVGLASLYATALVFTTVDLYAVGARAITTLAGIHSGLF
jgi:hypothetical protein